MARAKNGGPLPTIGTILGVLMLSLPGTSAADPVALSYNVVVNQRCQAGTCQPFRAVFDLTVTFDSRVVESGGTTTSQFARYGDPTFSAVPLDRPAVIPAAGDSFNTVTRESWQRFATGVSYQFAAQREYATPNTSKEWHVGLSLTQRVSTAPELSAGSLVDRLLTLGPARFTYFYDELDSVSGDLAPSSIGYVGMARLATDASPVPEPASMLLVGSGLCGVAAWRRRRLIR